METRKQDKTKRPFVITLPLELPNWNNVVGYDEIPKIGGSLATTPQAAILKYLHRANPEKKGLILNALRRGRGGIESFAFELPKVVGITKDLNSEEERIFSEYDLAYALQKIYHSKPFVYLEKAREIFRGFDEVCCL